jgi:acetyltransferase
MAIHPYPAHLAHYGQLPNGVKVCCRPIRPEDAELEKAFIQTLSDESKYFRFMQVFHELTTEMLVRFTQIDYDRVMALIAIIEENNQEIAIGIARYTTLPGQEVCEFGLVIADAWQHQGLGSHLMISLMDIAKSAGVKKIYGEILVNNYKMLLLMHELGFVISNTSDKAIKMAEKLII